LHRRRTFLAIAAAAGAVLTFSSVASARPEGAARSAARTITAAPAFTPAQQLPQAGDDWITIGGGLTNDRHSTLDQINTGNVANLRLAWRTELPGVITFGGQFGTNRSSAQSNAIEHDGVLYIPQGSNVVQAIDGATGEILWRYNPGYAKSFQPIISANRGLGLGEGKLFMGQLDGNLVALDQKTGKLLWKTKLGRPQDGYGMTSAALYYDGMVIQGMSGGDWGARGFMAAFDADNGRELWRFYIIPQPGEIGAGTWRPGEWEFGGGAIWLSSSVDPELGMVYAVTGNPVPWNGRGAGSNLFTDSVLALDVHTGQYRWHYQTVHHDLWDYDLPNPPFSFDIDVNGTPRKALGAAGKTGWVYILDRTTGLPLYRGTAGGAIVEKKVPQDRYANTWKTQPHVVGTPFVKQCSTRADWKKPAPDGKLYKVGCIFTPYNPSRFLASRPSASGGVDWPPASYSTETKYAYVCATESPGSGLGALPKRLIDPQPGDLFSVLGVNFGGGATGKTTGVFAAVDMRNHSIAWKKPWAAPCYSGSFNTAGGLVFVGQTAGTYLAYDAQTGAQLWASPRVTDAIINAPGMTYAINGKQYVTVMARGIKGNDAIYTYALPS